MDSTALIADIQTCSSAWMVPRLAQAFRKKFVVRRTGLRRRWRSRGLFDRRQFASWTAPWGRRWPPGGRLARVHRFTMKDGKIAQIESFADPERLELLELALLPD